MKERPTWYDEAPQFLKDAIDDVIRDAPVVEYMNRMRIVPIEETLKWRKKYASNT